MEEREKEVIALPSPERLREIAAKQDAKAGELKESRKAPKPTDERDNAAKVIQKNYRGHRERRALQGYGLDPASRWMELLKDAKYFNDTRATSRHERSAMSPGSPSSGRVMWKKAETVLQRAGNDDTSSESDVNAADEEERLKLRERKSRQKKEREKHAKTMGLEYFLEMVDQKHRYGSNLRRYHAEWKKADTNENFFYWLDLGEGKDLSLEDRPRSRLDTECVRYLSREERQRYLVNIDNDGRFCWAKNDQPITTSPEFRDSIDGIVPVEDKTPTWREVTTGVAPEPSPPGSSSSSLSGISTGSQEDSSKYVNHDKGLDKLSIDAVMNHMLRKTTKKNTWIFVADTSFRLYVSIKQSGAFQHSSFLRGARVSAAGLIKVKRGQLRKLSPLSGHYAPPLKNFQEFVKSLKSEGADLTRLNLGRSYAVLLGLEGYIEAKQNIKTAGQGIKDIANPDGKKQREEAAKDMSKSAQREREILKQQEEEKRRRSLSYRFRKKLGFDNDRKSSEVHGKT